MRTFAFVMWPDGPIQAGRFQWPIYFFSDAVVFTVRKKSVGATLLRKQYESAAKAAGAHGAFNGLDSGLERKEWRKTVELLNERFRRYGDDNITAEQLADGVAGAIVVPIDMIERVTLGKTRFSRDGVRFAFFGRCDLPRSVLLDRHIAYADVHKAHKRGIEDTIALFERAFGERFQNGLR